jgi:hypothetical protein
MADLSMLESVLTDYYAFRSGDSSSSDSASRLRILLNGFTEDEYESALLTLAVRLTDRASGWNLPDDAIPRNRAARLEVELSKYKGYPAVNFKHIERYAAYSGVGRREINSRSVPFAVNGHTNIAAPAAADGVTRFGDNTYVLTSTFGGAQAAINVPANVTSCKVLFKSFSYAYAPSLLSQIQAAGANVALDSERLLKGGDQITLDVPVGAGYSAIAITILQTRVLDVVTNDTEMENLMYRLSVAQADTFAHKLYNVFIDAAGGQLVDAYTCATRVSAPLWHLAYPLIALAER